jgi:iron complex outermembrane recepter protein
MRAQGLLLETPQTVNMVPAQVMRDQVPRNLDDALANISGITQTNTLGQHPGSVMKRVALATTATARSCATACPWCRAGR